MNDHPSRSVALRLSSLLVVAIAVAACGGGGAGPTPSPTPIESPGHAVTTPAQAATRVGETDQRFLGIAEQSAALIGASAWWTAESTPDGGFRVTFTSGWGDCPAGCINRHNWIFEVSSAGVVTPAGESGDPVPAR